MKIWLADFSPFTASRIRFGPSPGASVNASHASRTSSSCAPSVGSCALGAASALPDRTATRGALPAPTATDAAPPSEFTPLSEPAHLPEPALLSETDTLSKIRTLRLLP